MRKYDRNYAIDFLRFIFSIIVVMTHTNGLRPPDKNSYPFVGGYLAVEFFLILSGFFMMQSIYSSDDKVDKENYGRQSLEFIFMKMKPIFPYYIWSLLSYLAVYNFLNSFSSYEFLKNITYSFFELFMLQMTGISQVVYNAPTWYLSALLLSMPVLYYLGLKNKDFLIYIFAPVFVILIYGFFSQSFGQMDVWNNYILVAKAGVLRGIAGLCVGIVCYSIYLKISKLKFSKRQRLIMTILEILGYLAVIIILFMKGHSRLDFILIFAIAALILITLSGQSYTQGFLNNRVSYWLGQFSIPLYLTHWTIRFVVPKVFDQGSYWEWMPIYLVLSMVYAGVVFGAYIYAKYKFQLSKFRTKIMSET
ncbi:acyltransferase family protein [Anoxybacterium hadale]|uniref:acyltransferase family protein n=1 Tax=Anoxybacterium hadale TaxID=3408580 RepID=UPI003AFFAC7B